MKQMEEKILKEGKVYPGNILKVSNFLNHRLDVKFLGEIGREIARLYKDEEINKIMTIEASGIAIAVMAANVMDVPVVFAKKGASKNLSNDVYQTEVKSFTHKNISKVVVSKEFITKEDRILIIDDFLAEGNALNGLIDIINQAGARVVGCAIAIEKAFQNGGKSIRSRGIRVESLAMIESMTDDSITFVTR